MIITEEKVEAARSFGRMLHRGQIDRDGLPHYYHTERVASRMPTNFLRAVALLHDVFEDTDIPREAIRFEFGEYVTYVVEVLTRGEEETWRHYITRILRCPPAVLVKIADIEDNIARADEQFAAKLPMYQETLNILRSHSYPRSVCTKAAA